MSKIRTPEQMDLDLATENIKVILRAMGAWFPDCKMTLVVRHKTSYESSMLLTQDDPREVINAIKYLGKKIKEKK